MGKEELLNQVISKLDKLEKIPDIAMKAGLAYAGYKATNHWTGAIAALVSLKLATGNNLAGGVAGVAGLTLVGLGNAFKPRTTGVYYEGEYYSDSRDYLRRNPP